MRFRRRRGLGGRPSRDEASASADHLSAGDGPSGNDGRPWRRWGRGFLLVLLAFGVGWLVATRLLFPSSRAVGEGEVVEVPELVGLAAQEARTALQDAGLEYRLRTEVSHPKAPEGAVVAQSPVPGGYARPGAPVEITLSLGPEHRRVPDLRGLSGRQARITLEKLGFRVSTDSVRSAVERGRVVETRPASGERLQVPADVTLMVSEGPRVSEVPRLVGRHVDDLRRLLERRNFRLGDVTYDPGAPAAPGRVVAQNPPPGYGLREGGEVSVRVAGERPEQASVEPDDPQADTTEGGLDGGAGPTGGTGGGDVVPPVEEGPGRDEGEDLHGGEGGQR